MRNTTCLDLPRCRGGHIAITESWELDTVTLTTIDSVPELTFKLEIVIIFDVRLICKFSEMFLVTVEIRPRYSLTGIE
jgi:hypothetical protein